MLAIFRPGSKEMLFGGHVSTSPTVIMNYLSIYIFCCFCSPCGSPEGPLRAGAILDFPQGLKWMCSWGVAIG